MKTIKEFRHVDPDNKIRIVMIPVGEDITAKHPYFERMKKEGCLGGTKKTSKKKMTDPDAE